MNARRSCAVLIAVAATVGAGCLGFPSTPPPAPSYFMAFEEGSGYHDMISYSDTAGPFPIRPALDLQLETLYVGFSDGRIHAWNFTNKSAVVHSPLPDWNASCAWGGLAVLPNHSLAAACGANLSLINSAGATRQVMSFPSNISDIAVARAAGEIAVGFGPPFGIEIRNLTTGDVIGRYPADGVVRQISIDDEGLLIAASTTLTTTVYRIGTGINWTFGGGTAVSVSGDGSTLWLIEKVGDGPYDALRAFSFPTLTSARFSIPLENSSSLSMGASRFEVYSSQDGREGAYFAVLGAYSFANGGFHPLPDKRNIVNVYGESGSFIRGLAIPGEAMLISPLGNGSVYVVSAARAVIGGAALWLSVGEPECLPPILVRHNGTA